MLNAKSDYRKAVDQIVDKKMNLTAEHILENSEIHYKAVKPSRPSKPQKVKAPKASRPKRVRNSGGGGKGKKVAVFFFLLLVVVGGGVGATAAGYGPFADQFREMFFKEEYSDVDIVLYGIGETSTDLSGQFDTKLRGVTGGGTTHTVWLDIEVKDGVTSGEIQALTF